MNPFVSTLLHYQHLGASLISFHHDADSSLQQENLLQLACYRLCR